MTIKITLSMYPITNIDLTMFVLEYTEFEKFECTIYQELALARHFVLTHQVAAVFCVKWRHDRHLHTVTWNRKSDSVNHLWVNEHSCQISVRSDLKRRFLKRSLQQEEEQQDEQQYD